MLPSWVLVISALGGPLPSTALYDPRDDLAELVDDGPGLLLSGSIAAREPALVNRGRHGPVPAKDLNPLHTVFFMMAPERAEVLRAGKLAVHLNVSRTNSMEGWSRAEAGSGLLHLETTRTEMVARLGLGRGLEGAISVPWIERQLPVMDGFIGWVEQTATQGMMASRRRYQGASPEYEVMLPGEGLVRSSAFDGGAGDTSLSLKGKLWNEGRFLPAVSMRGAVKLPTGDFWRGFGSHGVDLAVGLSFEKALWSWLNVYGTVAGTLPFSKSQYVKAFGIASFAVEGVISRALSLVLQFNTASSPYGGTGVDVLDGRDDLWIAALNYRLPVNGNEVRFSLYAVENACHFPGVPWARSAHDFTVGLNLSLEPLARAF